MDVYGLTGGIGSGKSTVAALLEDYGVPVVSADELSRIVVSPGSEGLAEVVEEFGQGVLDDKGGLDRAKLAAVVFADPEKRRRLEEILHPRIRERYEQVLDAMEKAGHEVAIYEVPLLFEKNLQGDMKATLLVTAPDAVRVRRVCARDNITETEVRARIAAQMPEEQKRRRADYIIENDGNIDALRREVEFLLARFLRVSGVARRGPASEEVVASPSEIERDPSLPHALPEGPSRARTEIPTRAPVRTGQTLPPGMTPGVTPVASPAATDQPPRPDTTLPAATIVPMEDSGAAALPTMPSGPIPTAPSGPIPTAPSGPIPTTPSAPIPTAAAGPIRTAPTPVADAGSMPPSTGTPPAPPPAPATTGETLTPGAGTPAPIPPTPSAPPSVPPKPQAATTTPDDSLTPDDAPADAAKALSRPPTAPPLRKPTGGKGPAKPPTPPPKRATASKTLKAPPLRPPPTGGPPAKPSDASADGAKPAKPSPAPATKPPTPPPPAPGQRMKTLVSPPAPPSPPRGQTERVPAIAPQGEEEPS